MSNNNNFSTVLIRYMNLLNLNNKELSDATGLSPSVISRYVSGKRMPHHNSEQLKAIARAIYDLSSEGNVINQSYKEILNELKSTLTEDPKQVNAYINRLYTLIKSLNINVKDMAVAISFDDSFIYKILSGKTKPRNKDIFNEQIARYVAKKYSSKENLTMLSDILRKDINSLNSQEIYEEIYSYLLTETVLPQNDIDSFLKKLDELDIDSFNQNIMVDQNI